MTVTARDWNPREIFVRIFLAEWNWAILSTLEHYSFAGFNQTCQHFHSSLAIAGCTKRGQDIFDNCIVIELSAIQDVTCFIFETSKEKCSQIVSTQTPVFTPCRFKICLFKIAKMIFWQLFVKTCGRINFWRTMGIFEDLAQNSK